MSRSSPGKSRSRLRHFVRGRPRPEEREGGAMAVAQIPGGTRLRGGSRRRASRRRRQVSALRKIEHRLHEDHQIFSRGDEIAVPGGRRGRRPRPPRGGGRPPAPCLRQQVDDERDVEGDLRDDEDGEQHAGPPASEHVERTRRLRSGLSGLGIRSFGHGGLGLANFLLGRSLGRGIPRRGQRGRAGHFEIVHGLDLRG